MAIGSLESNCLRIRRLRVDCLVPSDHPSPERVSQQVAEVAERNLPQALRFILERGFAEADPSLCFIKRLDVSIDINAVWDTEQLARHFATHVVQLLYAEISAGSNSLNVVRFKNPAAYLASFLSDLVHGQAWTRWYYEPFDGVRVLPLSAAIRTVLCNHPAHAMAALHGLDEHSLWQMLASLTNGDCERIVESLTVEGGAGDQDAAYEALEATLRQLPYADLRRLSPEGGALWLYIETARRNGGFNGRSVGEAAYVICRCVEYVDSVSASDRERMLHLLRTGDLTRVDASTFANAVDWLVPLLSCPEAWRRGLIDLLTQEDQHAAQRQAGYGEALRTTPFGGIFYLLPLFMEIPLEDQVRRGAGVDGVAMEAILRWLIFTKVYGCQEAVAVARDPLVQELCGIPPGVVSRSFLLECQRTLAVSDLERIARHVTERGFDIGEQTKKAWVLTTVATKEGAVTVLFDALRGAWLWAVRAGFSHLDFTIRKVKQTLDEWSTGIHLIACDAPYYRSLKSMGAFDLVLDLSAPREEQSKESQLLTAVTRHIGILAEELDYLSLPAVFGLSRARDRALSAVAHAYLRCFASRLTGFGWSTGQYLTRNLLDFQASVEQEPERYVVRLSHPPLHLLLNMTGLNRKQYTLPWFDGRPIMLFPETV